jgi:hypothetical protein
VNLERGKVYTAFGIVAFNLILFILSMQYVFLVNVHHHWILPWVPGAVGPQWVLGEFLCAKYFKNISYTLRTSYLGLVGFGCLVGLARHETILECYMHCGYKLALMMVLSCLIFFGVAWRYGKGTNERKVCFVLSGVWFVVGLVVLHFSH